jgi:hypothetical protein
VVDAVEAHYAWWTLLKCTTRLSQVTPLIRVTRSRVVPTKAGLVNRRRRSWPRAVIVPPVIEEFSVGDTVALPEKDWSLRSVRKDCPAGRSNTPWRARPSEHVKTNVIVNLSIRRTRLPVILNWIP